MQTNRPESIDFFEKVYDYVFRLLNEDVCLRAYKWSADSDDISFYVYKNNLSHLSTVFLFLECSSLECSLIKPRWSRLTVNIDLETLHKLKYKNKRRPLRLTRRRQRRRLLKAVIGKTIYYNAVAAHGRFKVCLNNTVLVDVSSIEEFLINIDLTCTVQT